MELWKPDPTFYPSPKLAGAAPPEKHAFVALLNPKYAGRADAIAVVDVDPSSSTYAQQVGQVEMPNVGDELHHFGWNACSACLCPYAPHPHTERRYLVVPGIRSSRIHIIDTKPDPRKPKIVKVIEAGDHRGAHRIQPPAYRALRTQRNFCQRAWRAEWRRSGGNIHARPGQLRRSRKMGIRSRAAIFRLRLLVAPGLRHADFQRVGHAENGGVGRRSGILLKGGYGHSLHVWDLRKRRHVQALDLGAEQQMVLELRPAHDPAKAYGFVGVVVSLKDLSASVWLWHRENGQPGR